MDIFDSNKYESESISNVSCGAEKISERYFLKVRREMFCATNRFEINY